MHSLILILPLLSFLLILFFGRQFGSKGSSIISIINMAFVWIISIIVFTIYIRKGEISYIHLLTWISTDAIDIQWELMIDSITVVMLVVVNTVSLLVHIYSVEYMANDPHLSRFMSYLSLFTFCMLVLITSNNYIQLFFGWEGVGVSSYLLINFWYTRIEANTSSMKAIIVNRIGDYGLALGIFTLYFIFKSFDFNVIFALVPHLYTEKMYFFITYGDAISIISILLFIGCIGKSAQLSLHTWLPDAMEGPTPVSALIHAATMVTAGVFLLIRSSPLIEHSSKALLVITIIGALTAFFAATTGILQHDLKKVIAYSTCSQLGYMVFICGLSNYTVSLFHLMNHAFFKALLFLSAGSIIHAMNDEQDMRKMGGLIRIVPYTYVMIMIGSLSLMGFPFLSGFYSKDAILELAYANYSLSGDFAYWLGIISAIFTAYYSIRLIYLTFIANTNAYKQVVMSAHDSSYLMAIPMGVLCIGSIFTGYVFKDMFIGLGTDFWENSIVILPKHESITNSEFIPAYIKILPVVLSILGGVLAMYLGYIHNKMQYKLSLSKNFNNMYWFIHRKWNFDDIYNAYIANFVLKSSDTIFFKTIDRGYIELLGPYGLKKVFQSFTYKSILSQTGYVSQYIGYIFWGLSFMYFYMLLHIEYVNYSNSICLSFIVIALYFFYSFFNKN
jgi:proton-translocating NADH-quinone oxidoreductase chain L